MLEIMEDVDDASSHTQELDVHPSGNIVFVESIPGAHANKRALEKMTEALDLLGIPSYAIQLDDKVEESLSSIVSNGSRSRLRKKSNPRLRPRYAVLDPVTHHDSLTRMNFKPTSPEKVGRRPKITQRTRSQRILEIEAQFSILRLHVQEICGVNPEGWVLLVETQMKRVPDVLKLENLANQFNFRIHWLTMGSKKRCESKFNDIVVEILKDKNERKRIKPKGHRSDRMSEHSNNTADTSEIQILHDSPRTMSAASSYLSTDSGDRATAGSSTAYESPSLTTPPFFPKGYKKTGDSTQNLDPRDSVTTLVTTDSGGSISSIFEVKSDENLAALSRVPAPDLDHLLEIGNRDPNNNIEEEKPTFVVTVRDLFPGARSQLATTLKTMLNRDGIRSYVMSVSNMFTQPRAVNLMKRYAEESGHVPTDINRGCKILIINGLHYKLSEQKQRVIIVDLEDESVVRMFPIHDFCIRAGVKTLPLEKRADGSFEQNLNKVYRAIRKGIPGPHKPRKYKLPKLNEALLEQLKPVVMVSSNLMKPKPEYGSTTAGLVQSVLELTTSKPLAGTRHEMKTYDDNGNELPRFQFTESVTNNPNNEDEDSDNNEAESFNEMLADERESQLFCTTEYEKYSIPEEDEDSNPEEEAESEASGSDSDNYEDIDDDAEEEDAEATPTPSQATVVKVQNTQKRSDIVTETDEEANFSSVYDFIPNEAPPPGSPSDSDDAESIHFHRFKPKLIEIQRWQDRKPVRKKRDVRYLNHLPRNQGWDVDSSDESLFIGWVGRVKPEGASKPRFISRLLSRISKGIRKYVIRPMGKVLRLQKCRSATNQRVPS